LDAGVKKSFGLTVVPSDASITQLPNNTFVQKNNDIVKVNGGSVTQVRGNSFDTFEPFEGYFILSPTSTTLLFNGTELGAKLGTLSITNTPTTFSIGRREDLPITSILNNSDHHGVRIEYDNTFMHLYRDGSTSVLSNNIHLNFTKGSAYMVTATGTTNSIIEF
tara:strand:- start:333 stop:824 length:492 start_codon:yes stop_codon:yes gene_type:complete